MELQLIRQFGNRPLLETFGIPAILDNMFPSLLFTLLVMASIVISAAIFMWFLFYVVFWSNLKGAPFVPSEKDRIRTMIELAEIRAGTVCYDLGSGNGAILFEAAQKGADARGIEINPFLAWHTRRRAKKMNIANVSVTHANFRDVPLYDADVVFLYLWPHTNASLREKLSSELKPGSLIISNSFIIKGMMPERIENSVYRYRMI
ncbi:MAG: methyltransferase domain-containing protein [Candidatus Sungbacteria bacterium]|nr:methyltransferase domain-containing protein [Candidatus Sungbacteria bacterium]